MIVKIKLFGPAAQIVGSPEILIQLMAPGTDCHAVMRAIRQQYPQLAPLMPSARLAVNCAYCQDDSPVTSHDELALIQAVSGG